MAKTVQSTLPFPVDVSSGGDWSEAGELWGIVRVSERARGVVGAREAVVQRAQEQKIDMGDHVCTIRHMTTESTMRALSVRWQRCSLEEGLKLDGEEDYGLYQIHGYHPVYGSDTACLLYVGKAAAQTFAARLQQHMQAWLEIESGLHPGLFSIRVGRVEGYRDPGGPEKARWSDWTLCVDHAEKLTIWFNAPAYNSMNIAPPPNITLADRVTVRNLGEDTGGLLGHYSWPPEADLRRRGDEV